MNYCIVYVSTAYGLQDSELELLLTKSREKNKQLEITGVLLYCNGSLLQVLEGEQDKILDLYAVIKADKRHKRVLTLFEGSIKDRTFASWSMGYKTLSSNEMAELSRELPVIENPREKVPYESVVISLVSSFYQNNFRN
jgi:hypothetical protein